jgi:hypothetical protein
MWPESYADFMGAKWCRNFIVIETWNYHLVMTNIAMENPNHKWRFLAGKIIYKWAMASMAMLDNQSVAGKFPVGHLNGRFSGKPYLITRGYCSKTVLRGWNFHPCPTYGIEDIQLSGVGSRS